MKKEDEILKSQMGNDIYGELEQKLVKELSDSIDEQILTEITGMNKEQRKKYFERMEKIDKLLNEEQGSERGN